jgi:hypothetical protein
MKWIKLSDRTPVPEIDGKKVLICRLLNDSQAEQNPSVFPTNMVKACNKDETWWMSLPELPIGLRNLNRK